MKFLILILKLLCMCIIFYEVCKENWGPDKLPGVVRVKSTASLSYGADIDVLSPTEVDLFHFYKENNCNYSSVSIKYQMFKFSFESRSYAKKHNAKCYTIQGSRGFKLRKFKTFLRPKLSKFKPCKKLKCCSNSF